MTSNVSSHLPRHIAASWIENSYIKMEHFNEGTAVTLKFLKIMIKLKLLNSVTENSEYFWFTEANILQLNMYTLDM